MENKRIGQLKQFLEQSPGDAFLRYALAIEYVGMSRDETAREILEQLMQSDPEYHATYYHLGKLYERAGLYESALDTYRKGIGVTRGRKEHHALRELQNALNELSFELED